MKRSFYGDLRVGNEIDAYYLKSSKRCQIIKIRKDSDRVRLALKPVTIGKIFNATFIASAPVWIYSTSYVVERAQAIIPNLLEILPPEEPSWTLDGIKLVYRKQFGKAPNKIVLTTACDLLTEAGRLIKRERGKCSAYRRPLPCRIEMPVVELPRTKSERFGWIVGSQIMKATGKAALIVHWLDGSQTAAAEERLEPLKGNLLALRKVRIAQAIARGEFPDGFVEIPQGLIWQIAEQAKVHRITTETLLAIAETLNWSLDSYKDRSSDLRHAILDYLDLYHPNWRRGIVRILEQQHA